MASNGKNGKVTADVKALFAKWKKAHEDSEAAEAIKADTAPKLLAALEAAEVPTTIMSGGTEFRVMRVERKDKESGAVKSSEVQVRVMGAAKNALDL